jgi:periplasmic protein TonB
VRDRPEPSLVSTESEEDIGEERTEAAVLRLSDTRSLGPRAAKNPERPESSRSGPMALIEALDRRASHFGTAFGLVGALLLHGVAAIHGYTSLLELGSFVENIRSAVLEDLRATYAVELDRKPPPPPPVPEKPVEPPKPEPTPQKLPAPANPAQQAEKPPAPAQAGKVLTAAADPDAPLDLTGEGFVSGDGERFVGGVTAAQGTSTQPVRATTARIGGAANGTGQKAVAAAPPAPTVDRSQAPRPTSTSWDDCGFPPEADSEQIDYMRVKIMVKVGLDGRAQSANVLSDPGYGFGPLAQRCALRKTYSVGLDVSGNPVVVTTPPFFITFRR